MNRLTKILIVAVSLAVFSYASLGYVLNKQADDNKSYRSLNVYGEVLQRIQEEYVEEPNIAKVTVGALHGLLESLDPLSSYMSPQEYTEYKKQMAAHPGDQFGGVLSKRSGYIIIVSVLPDSPADKAGLRTGNLLEAISGFTTREMSVGQASNLLNGASGSTVKVSVVRRGSTECAQIEPNAASDICTDEVTITRGPVALPRVVSTKLSSDTAYLRVESLEKGKAEEIRAKLAELDHDGVRKLVLDLRGCASGDDNEGVAVARLFLNSGTITSLRGQTTSRQDFTADASKQVWNNPVAVLTSAATSGAAEIVAAAIGGNHRGDVVGEHTFGTASHQKLIEFDDGSAIVLTDAFYYTPDNKSILDEGVPPTVEVTLQLTEDPAAFSREENPPMTPQAPADDAVLSKALDLLNGGSRKVAERPARPRYASPQPAG
jgi:carboxyl-terminal processing protease